MRPTTPDYRFAQPAGPSSPPETPTSPTFTFGMNMRSTKRNGVYNPPRPVTTPKGHSNPVGQGLNFGYNPSMRPEDISPRSSSPSTDSSGSPPRSLSSEPEEPEILPQITVVRERRVSNGNFTIEELREGDSDYESDDDISVVHPDQYEDAASDLGRAMTPVPAASDRDEHDLADGLEKLDCNNHDDDREEWLQQQRKLRRKKRLSAGSLHKRTISQSIGSDTDDEDLTQLDANEAGSTARRLRRKTGDRGSLLFSDPPQMILEMNEPDSDEEAVPVQVAVPDVEPGVEELGLHSLPYYDMDIDSDSMEVDSEEEEEEENDVDDDDDDSDSNSD